VHMDIKPNQIVLVNGTYKMNDFSFCEYLRWNPKEDKYCSFGGGYVGRVSVNLQYCFLNDKLERLPLLIAHIYLVTVASARASGFRC
jgi:hypothetical protein